MASQNIDIRYGTLNQVARDQYIIHNSERGITLDILKPSIMDASTRSACLEGTRLDVIQRVREWVNDSSSHGRLLWLYGLAGSGKSTLATTLANSLRDQGCLAAFIFFDRDSDERSDPTTVIRTLVYQLGCFYPAFKREVLKILDTIPGITYFPLHQQFHYLLVGPLRKAQAPMSDSQLPLCVVVIDSMDECGSTKSRRELLHLLSSGIKLLPRNVRFVLTSRDEFDIRNAFGKNPHVIKVEMDITSIDNHRDIQSFFHERLSAIRLQYCDVLSLEADWPGERAISSLADSASGLFIWASIASSFIEDGHDPRKQLDLLTKSDFTSTSGISTLDTLYSAALRASGRWEDPDFRADFCAILGAVVVARTPLSLRTIERLSLVAEDRPPALIVSRLGCVLAQRPTVQVLHPSFAEFISDRDRCGAEPWFVDPSSHHLALAIACLQLLQRVLKANMCNLKFSPSPGIPSLEEHVAYACSFWVDHICAIVETETIPSVVDTLDGFVFQHLLHWLEAMSILNRSRQTPLLLKKLLIWIKTHAAGRIRLLKLAEESLGFSSTFWSTYDSHPLAVYVSALPFIPHDSLLYRVFHAHDSWITSRFPVTWTEFLQYRGKITSAALSPDGTAVAFGTTEAGFVWEVAPITNIPIQLFELPATRNAIFSPDGSRILTRKHSDREHDLFRLADGARLEYNDEILSSGHIHSHHTVASNSLAFSPDGKSVVAGFRERNRFDPDGKAVIYMNFSADGSELVICFEDGTVCNRDIKTHHERTRSGFKFARGLRLMTFSPDGYYLVGQTIFSTRIGLWDTGSGKTVLDIRDVTCLIIASTFSPKSERLALGFENGTIRVVDIESKTSTFLLGGHHAGVNCIGFSADGKQLVSTSLDRRVHFWDVDAELRKRNIMPADSSLDIHDITTLSFSPDGTQIITGSTDGTIYFIDAESWDTVVGPLQAHDGNVLHVCFTQQGERMLSCSTDQTILVSSVTSGSPIIRLRSDDHTFFIAAFSPDGTRIVGGSSDGTLHVWDAHTGARIHTALDGHAKRVTAIAFSPDGKRIVSASQDTSTYLWDAASGVQLLGPMKAYPYRVSHVKFSMDGNFITASYNATNLMSIWDATSGVCIDSPTRQHDSRCQDSNLIVFTWDGWIMDVTKTPPRVVSMLPHPLLKTLSLWASTPDKIAIVSGSHQLFVMYINDIPDIGRH